MKKFFSILGNDIFLGAMIALLSIFTAAASYQGAMADSEQNKYELKGMQSLNDGNAEYLRTNQDITQDYNYFDNWYLNADERPEIAEYYQSSFSEQLNAAIERDPETVWDDQYYEDMYAESDGYFEESDANFEIGSQYDELGDQLQLILTIMAIGLAFAAWASLNKEDGKLRPFFSLLSVIIFVIGLIIYFSVPAISI
ncbi:MAG: hypothetical protein HZB50_07155 [Chloroflexi bacterium]|nr:hypothetical protein [Chloroflexota bacterium]